MPHDATQRAEGPTEGFHTGDPHRGPTQRGPTQGTHTGNPNRGPTQRGGGHRGPTTGGEGHTGDPHRTHTDIRVITRYTALQPMNAYIHKTLGSEGHR